MKNNKITLDFTQATSQQEVAVMPAKLAQKLLKDYAKNLSYATARDIIQLHMKDLEHCKNMNDLKSAVEISANFVQERQLITNISEGNWDVYKVEQVTEEVVDESLIA